MAPVYAQNISSTAIPSDVQNLKVNQFVSISPASQILIDVSGEIKMVLERTTGAVDRLEKIAMKIESRLIKLKASGVKTAKMEKANNTVKTQILKLRSDWVVAEKDLTDWISGGNPESEYPAIREKLVSVHKSLKSLLVLERNLLVEMKPYAIKTASPSAGPSLNQR